MLTDRDEMGNLHSGHSIDASYMYQVSVHLAKRFQRRRSLKIGQSETRIAFGGHVWLRIIDASYQVSDHLAKQFQRRIFLEINQSETKIACGGHVC